MTSTRLTCASLMNGRRAISPVRPTPFSASLREKMKKPRQIRTPTDTYCASGFSRQHRFRACSPPNDFTKRFATYREAGRLGLPPAIRTKKGEIRMTDTKTRNRRSQRSTRHYRGAVHPDAGNAKKQAASAGAKTVVNFLPRGRGERRAHARDGCGSRLKSWD